MKEWRAGKDSRKNNAGYLEQYPREDSDIKKDKMEEKLNSISQELANYQLNDLKRHAEVLEQLKEHKYKIDDMYKKLSEESERLSTLSKKLYDYMDIMREKLSLFEYSLKKNEIPPRKRWWFF